MAYALDFLRPDRARFPLEARQAIRLDPERGRQDLDGE
jgi:hypothetical protein